MPQFPHLQGRVTAVSSREVRLSGLGASSRPGEHGHDPGGSRGTGETPRLGTTPVSKAGGRGPGPGDLAEPHSSSELPISALHPGENMSPRVTVSVDGSLSEKLGPSPSWADGTGVSGFM